MNLLPPIRPYFIQPFAYSAVERRYFLLGLPIFVLSGNVYLVGIRYVQEGAVFLVGTVVSALVYGLLIVTLRMVVRGTLRRFAQVRQAVLRTLVMLGVAAMVTTGLAVLYVWSYSLVPLLNVSFRWSTVQPVWVISYIVDVFLCTGISVYYTYSQWETHQVENDRLKRIALQHQFETLKSDLNPHFLFNSLNSLSALISEDAAQAERFVDDLARVYRYLLQAGKRELVSLQVELDYTRVYANLLQIRYGNSLTISLQAADEYLMHQLPPLTIQTLIDNAIKHNIMSVPDPLLIAVSTTPDGSLQARNIVQRKINRVETTRAGLANLTARYSIISNEKVSIQQEGQWFVVTVPLIHLDPV